MCPKPAPDSFHPTRPKGNFKLRREVTLIVLGIMALIAALTKINYGVVANHATKKPNQSSRGHLRPGRPCYSGHAKVFVVSCLYGHGPPPSPDFLLVKQGGVCAIANISCCTYINFRHCRGTWRLHSPTGYMALRTVPQNSDIHTDMGSNKILAPLQNMVPTLCGTYSCRYSLTCVWTLHFKLTCQVFFLSPGIHQTTDAPNGDENNLLSQSPW
jgi:hypothetical protein